MSLINDMLKNLEKRFDGAKKNFATQPIELQEEETIFFKAFLMTLAILVVAGLVWGSIHFYHRYKNHVTPPSTGQALSLSAGQTTVGPKPAVPPPPKLVSAIHVNDLPAQTELSIDLNAAPTYLTSMDPTTHTLSLTLQNTYLTMSQMCAQLKNPPNCATGNTLPLPLQGTALQSIQVEQNDGQTLLLNIKLSPTAALGGSQLSLNPVSLKLTFDKVASPNTDNSPTTLSNNNDDTTAQVDNGPSDDGDNMLQPIKGDVTLASHQPLDRITVAIEQHDFTKAQKIFDTLPSEVKNSSQGIMTQAKIDLGHGDNAAALNVMQSVPFEGQPAAFYALYAATLEFNKKHAQAVDIYKKLVNYWPDNPDWWLGLGIASLNNGENALADYAFHHLASMANLDPEVTAFVQAKLEELSIDNHVHDNNSY